MENSPPLPTFYIRPASSWSAIGLKELWEYRELLYFLVWRDVKVRYKQTALGAAWAIIQPLMMMIVFSLFFGYLAKVPSDGIPYPIFTFCALLPWQLFSHALTESSNSLVANERLITKVYFPRLVVPIAAVLGGMMDSPNPAELLGSDQMRRLIATLQSNFNHVVVDSPPVSSFTDGVLISSMVDGVLLVVHGGKSSRHIVRRSRQLLQDVGAKIFGVVLNNVNLQSHDYYYYQRYYSQRYYDRDVDREAVAGR